MPTTLLTVSGTIPPDISERVARGERPRADYLEMARAFDADLIDYAEARRRSGLIGRLLARFAGNDVLLAYACWQRRKQYQAIFTDGEQIGLPYALLSKFGRLGFGKRPRHLMIVHILSVPKKMVFLDALGLQSDIDTFFVYATWQKLFIQERWRVSPERVVFTPFMVDADFFSPDQVTPQPRRRPLVCSVGLEARDYPTMLEAVEGLPADFCIAAASPWSKRQDNTRGRSIPANVQVQRFSQYDLRQLYADSSFMVMPLQNVDFQAGVTAILEAMAMGKAVICSRTPGQTDVVVNGETGIYVPPGDPAALRQVIEYLLANPREAARMGQAGRRRILESMDLNSYVARLRSYLPAPPTNIPAPLEENITL